MGAQKAALLDLVRRAEGTRFGRSHDFAGIRSIEDYQARVGVGQYLDFCPLWTRVLEGERDVTWPGRPRYWTKTSGTTAGDKTIPVTDEAFASHRKGGWDALLLAAAKAGGQHLLGGPMLFLGGCTRLSPIGVNGLVGDLSGLVARRLPPGLRGRYSPGLDVSSIPDPWAYSTCVPAGAFDLIPCSTVTTSSARPWVCHGPSGSSLLSASGPSLDRISACCRACRRGS